jgi:phosphatidylglycerophosphate synthase
VALVAQLGLLVALDRMVGLGVTGWGAGVACALVMCALLTRAVRRDARARLGAATWVTITRASLAVGVAALAADAPLSSVASTALAGLAAVAVALDAVDGRLARRTGTVSALGARLDGEVDAFLIAALSVRVATTAGAWVLVIGAARYAFLVAGWLLPWLHGTLPPRHWRKVVAAIQGVVLTVAATGALPSGLARVSLLVALGLLAESFGRDVWWLWRHRPARPQEVPAATGGPARAAVAVVLTVLAVLVVWIALVVPDRPAALAPGAIVRLPLEAIVLGALAALLPPTGRRLLAWLAGPLLGLVLLVKLLDVGFIESFDRPFNPVDDWSYTGIGIETLRDSIGRTRANLLLGAMLLLVGVVLVATTLAVHRLTRVAARHRGRSLRLCGVLAATWTACYLLDVQVGPGTPVAVTSAAGLAAREVRAVRTGIADQAAVAGELAHDRYAEMPGDRLLRGLRGKDVILAFVESYGRVAVQGSAFAPQVDAALDRGTARLAAAGFAARSGFLTSPTFGGISWLAHSTLQSGIWVDSPGRYDELVASDRFTLSQAFRRAGWRTVDDVPSNDRFWPQGSSFYHWDRVYDRRDVGYAGPTFAYASMPDQYVLEALHRLELAKAERPPVFAEVDLVSSHTPWTRIPRPVAWSAIGDGSIYNRLPADEMARAALWSDPRRVQAAYGRSIAYTLDMLVAFVERYGNDDLVLVVLGDHQPGKIVTGPVASHDVPISVIARDPAVIRRIAAWGFEDGLRPDPHAPVWPMDAFRDRFLAAFGA